MGFLSVLIRKGRFAPLLAAWLLASMCAATSQAQSVLPPSTASPYLGEIRLKVDATDLDRRILRVGQHMPVRAGRLTLVFPRFLPGTHGPYGAVERLAGLKLRAGERELPWQRDTVQPHAFQVDVPEGVSELDLNFDYLTPTGKGGGREVMTREMLNLQWHNVVLYPAGHASSAVQVAPWLKLPAGWQQASALQVSGNDEAGVRFAPVSLETLIDSPVFAGAHLRRIELAPAGATGPVMLNLVADDASLLLPSEEQVQAHRQLVVQADRLFGARHFAKYDFLLALSEHLGGIGLEHHESSENAVRPNYFKDWPKRIGARELLPHEYVHSWNGKFRRPADLNTPDYHTPMQNSLLWVYEGQTQFWGHVLAARSGLTTPEQARDQLARTAAYLDSRSGRTWRNLQDTTNEGTLATRGDKDWGDWQRRADYYDEALLIWLDADMLVRERSNGQRSLDDFALAFFGVEPGRVQPLPYSFDDLVAALNQVLPMDWRAFLRERLDTTRAQAPLDGLTRAGWKLAWADSPSEFVRNDDAEWRGDDFAHSLGLNLKRDGTIDQVMWESPAFKAGLRKSLQLVAVNGLAYKAERLSAAVTGNKDGKAPIELLVKEGERYRTVRIDYRGGLRYPRLERVAGSTERLDAGLYAPRR